MDYETNICKKRNGHDEAYPPMLRPDIVSPLHAQHPVRNQYTAQEQKRQGKNVKIPGVKVQAVYIDILHQQKHDGMRGGN